jgi:hypothetical protein
VSNEDETLIKTLQTKQSPGREEFTDELSQSLKAN